jgi:integrase
MRRAIVAAADCGNLCHAFPRPFRALGSGRQPTAARAGGERGRSGVLRPDGGHRDADEFSRMVSKAARAAGVTATCHTLRRSLGTRLTNAGWNEKQVAMALGDADTATVSKHYSLPSREELPERPELRR